MIIEYVSIGKHCLQLHDYGIRLRGSVLKWVKGFLDNCHQSVIVNDLYLSHLEYLRGVCRDRFSFMYKITHNLMAIPISDFLIPIVRPYRHYHPLSYRLIITTTVYYKFSFFPRAVFHWNNLTRETVACPTLKQFNQAVCTIDHVPP